MDRLLSLLLCLHPEKTIEKEEDVKFGDRRGDVPRFVNLLMLLPFTDALK